MLRVRARLCVAMGLAIDEGKFVFKSNFEGSLSTCHASLLPRISNENNDFGIFRDADVRNGRTSFSAAVVINRGWEIKRENLDTNFFHFSFHITISRCMNL